MSEAQFEKQWPRELLLSFAGIKERMQSHYFFEPRRAKSRHFEVRIITNKAHVCIYRVQNVFLRCSTPRLHCFLSSHWPSFRFLSFMAFFIPSIQFFFGLPRALFCFGIHIRELKQYDYTLITNLMHWLLFIHKILCSSTCFEHQVLIFRRAQLYTCSIWYCHSL